MTNTSTVTPFKDDVVIVAARLGEDLLNRIIEMSKEGYTIVPGTARINILAPQVCMQKASEKAPEAPVEEVKQEVVVEPVVEEKAPEEASEEVVEDDVKTIDDQLIRSFNKDKDKLEEYGKTFGIDLKKSRSFVNMVKDLRAHVNKG